MDEIDDSSRTIHKGKLNVMWNGAWLELGEAEFLAEKGRVVKVLSYTPREFRSDDSPSTER